MFTKKTEKRITDRIEELGKKLDRYYTSTGITLGSLATTVKTLTKENKELKEQIDLLVTQNCGVLGEASDCQLFVYKGYRSRPVVYKDGKLVSDNAICSMRINMDGDGTISLETER